MFPFTSVTVNVTVFAPVLVHVNDVGEAVTVAMPHASLDPLLICDAVIDAVPEAFNCTVRFCVTTTGLTVSAKVTIAVPVLKFPLKSVTVKVTVFAPKLLQVNVDGVTDNVFIVQLSVDPLFTCAPVNTYVPFDPKYAVMFLVITLGLIVSSTVTVAVAVVKLPLPSVTVKVTVLFPMFAHVNVFGETPKVATEQLSVELLFT